jgi:hypothetical protein
MQAWDTKHPVIDIARLQVFGSIGPAEPTPPFEKEPIVKPSHKAAAGIVAALSLGLAAAAFAQSGPAAESHDTHGKTGMQHGKMPHGKMAGMQHGKMADMQKGSKEKDAKLPQQGATEHAH